MPAKQGIPVLRPVSWPDHDRDRWHAATRPAGWLDAAGSLARCPAGRLPILAAAYGRWLGFLSLRGEGLPVASGLDHFDEERVQAFYDALAAQLAPCTVRGYLVGLLRVTRGLAPHHAFPALEAAVRWACLVAEPVTNKRTRLVPARDLYRLGLALMEAAPALDTPFRRANTYRDGLMIALLALRPLRRGNFACIEIGRHLVKEAGVYWLVFPAEEVKNRQALEVPLTPTLDAAIDHYLDVYRPFLLARNGRWRRADPGNALWISGDGSAMRPGRIRERIERRTRERFGIAVNPHLFRDAAATAVAIEDPEHVHIIRCLLGHADARTGERYYNQARSLVAARRYQDVIEHLAAP